MKYNALIGGSTNRSVEVDFTTDAYFDEFMGIVSEVLTNENESNDYVDTLMSKLKIDGYDGIRYEGRYSYYSLNVKSHDVNWSLVYEYAQYELNDSIDNAVVESELSEYGISRGDIMSLGNGGHLGIPINELKASKVLVVEYSDLREMFYEAKKYEDDYDEAWDVVESGIKNASIELSDDFIAALVKFNDLKEKWMRYMEETFPATPYINGKNFEYAYTYKAISPDKGQDVMYFDTDANNEFCVEDDKLGKEVFPLTNEQFFYYIYKDEVDDSIEASRYGYNSKLEALYILDEDYMVHVYTRE